MRHAALANVSRCFGSFFQVARNVLDDDGNPLGRPVAAMLLRAVFTAVAAAVSVQWAHAQASAPTGSSEAPSASSAPASSAPAPEGGEKKRRLRFRDEKNACAPGALGESDIRATLTAKPAATEQPKRSDKQ